MFLTGFGSGFVVGAIVGALFVAVGAISMILVYSGVIRPEQIPGSVARRDEQRQDVVGV